MGRRRSVTQFMERKIAIFDFRGKFIKLINAHLTCIFGIMSSNMYLMVYTLPGVITFNNKVDMID